MANPSQLSDYAKTSFFMAFQRSYQEFISTHGNLLGRGPQDPPLRQEEMYSLRQQFKIVCAAAYVAGACKVPPESAEHIKEKLKIAFDVVEATGVSRHHIFGIPCNEREINLVADYYDCIDIALESCIKAAPENL